MPILLDKNTNKDAANFKKNSFPLHSPSQTSLSNSEGMHSGLHSQNSSYDSYYDQEEFKTNIPPVKLPVSKEAAKDELFQ